MNNWQEEYKRKMTVPETVASLVKKGSTVAFTSGREAHALGLALSEILLFSPYLEMVQRYTRSVTFQDSLN